MLAATAPISRPSRSSHRHEAAHPHTSPLLFSQNRGKTGGLALDDESLVGATMDVRFNGKGEPTSIKNVGNGNSCEVTDWWVTGYGW